MPNKKIAIFLSSHEGLPESYRLATQAVGEWVGRQLHTLIYGGARKGLMEVLAQSVKQNGGRVFGVVPQILIDRQLVSDTLDITFYCADLSDRKAIMMREGEIFIALPGGIGTLDEIFTILAANTIGLQHKHVVLYNVDQCWNQLLATLEQLCRQQLIHREALAFLHVVDNVPQLEALCEQW